MNYDAWKQKIEGVHFSIEPNGHRDVEVMSSFYPDHKYNDFIGLQFKFNNNYEYNINLSFDEAVVVNPRLEQQALLNMINKVAAEIRQKTL